MTDDSYYVLATVNRWQYNLPMDEGDRLATELDVMKNCVTSADPLYVRFTDTSGSEVRINVNHIEIFHTSTPETRARDKELVARQKAEKDWSEDE